MTLASAECRPAVLAHDPRCFLPKRDCLTHSRVAMQMTIALVDCSVAVPVVEAVAASAAGTSDDDVEQPAAVDSAVAAADGSAFAAAFVDDCDTACCTAVAAAVAAAYDAAFAFGEDAYGEHRSCNPASRSSPLSLAVCTVASLLETTETLHRFEVVAASQTSTDETCFVA